MSSFSARYGYKNNKEVEITIREDVPQEFRDFLIQLLYDIGFTSTKLREIFCRVLRKSPDNSNWSEPYIDSEVRRLLRECEWFKVYDILERILQVIEEQPYNFKGEELRTEISNFFIEEGYGWKISKSLIEMRSNESFEVVVQSAKNNLSKCQHTTANNELHEAIKDLSRRPSPDSTGAIQHSMASLECVAREITGDRKLTLGEIIKKNKNLIPKPLDQAVEKTWGFASEYGRHLKEGREPSFQEAELIVGICSSVGSYLLKLKKDNIF
ncbi:hypothetical protein H206_01252 [Candidatus Electrothrix aarhusensis]|uniref:HEPN AbiJ-N-terminal domain-containing protein n=1 Tax=Candidatus Electrothrix aarhusensis TaxID=1859131 RepID=A0A3S3U6L5_9BACT|nr:hypothetical protein H206_01252 [Candidatus Electrothrix aarhusensis]